MKLTLSLLFGIVLITSVFGQECSARFHMIGSGPKCGFGQFSVEDASGKETAIGGVNSGYINSAKNTRHAQPREIRALPEGKYITTLEDDDNNFFKLTPTEDTKVSYRSGMLIQGVTGKQSIQEASQWSIILDYDQRKKLRKYFDLCSEMVLTIEYR